MFVVVGKIQFCWHLQIEQQGCRETKFNLIIEKSKRYVELLFCGSFLSPKMKGLYLNSFNATRRCIVDIVSSICATRRCIVDIVSPSCATPRCIVDMRTNVSFATGGPDMKLFKFPMGDNSKWKSCLLRKCTFSIVIILRSIIIAFFRKRTLVSIVNKQWTHPPRNRLVVLLGLDASY